MIHRVSFGFLNTEILNSEQLINVNSILLYGMWNRLAVTLLIGDYVFKFLNCFHRMDNSIVHIYVDSGQYFVPIWI